MSVIVTPREWDAHPRDINQMRVAQRWLRRGLVYAGPIIGGRQKLPWLNAPTRVGGKPAIVRQSGALGTFTRLTTRGMAFGSTLGVGTTDRITSNALLSGTGRTIFATIHMRAAGGGGFGRVYSANDQELLFHSGNQRLSIQRATSGTAATWALGIETMHSFGETRRYAIRYDYASISNSPTVWTDGIQRTDVVATTTATGAFSTITGTLVIGNRNAADRNWDGAIADLAIFNSLLTDAEIEELTWQPWRLWEPGWRYLTTEASAPSIPALSAPTFVPGSKTSTGWRGRITAT